MKKQQKRIFLEGPFFIADNGIYVDEIYINYSIEIKVVLVQLTL
ncbi:hypothetical protein [Gottfriedia luciferensis]|nr:hypothetical protein [Gottfriedia luciferensis]